MPGGAALPSVYSNHPDVAGRPCAALRASYCVLRGAAWSNQPHDQHLAEWIRLTEQIEAEKSAPPVMELTRELDPEPEKKRGRPKKKLAQSAPVSGKAKGGRGKKEGIRAAARELGIDRDDARRALKVAGLTEEAL